MHKISWTGPRLFVIVGKNDNPIYEHNFSAAKESHYMAQFILHAALDLIDEMQWKIPQTYIKTIDKYNDLFISAYVTPSNARFLLLHEAKNEDAVRQFFTEVHELFIKVLMNPFYVLNTRITSSSFDQRVKQSGINNLRGQTKV